VEASAKVIEHYRKKHIPVHYRKFWIKAISLLKNYLDYRRRWMGLWYRLRRSWSCTCFRWRSEYACTDTEVLLKYREDRHQNQHPSVLLQNLQPQGKESERKDLGMLACLMVTCMLPRFHGSQSKQYLKAIREGWGISGTINYYSLSPCIKIMG